jgi:hypothetical protein
VIIAADSSQHGLGAIIQQQWTDCSVKAIAHVSYSMKLAELNYSQIEKEGLALYFHSKKLQ